MTLEDISSGPEDPDESGKPSTELTLSHVEKQHILRVLRKNGWEVKKSARELGIHRTTLYAKIRKYGIERPCP